MCNGSTTCDSRADGRPGARLEAAPIRNVRQELRCSATGFSCSVVARERGLGTRGAVCFGALQALRRDGRCAVLGDRDAKSEKMRELSATLSQVETRDLLTVRYR